MPTVSFRCNNEEYARIRARATTAGQNVSIYARESLLGPETPSNARTPDARVNSLAKETHQLRESLDTFYTSVETGLLTHQPVAILVQDAIDKGRAALTREEP